MVRERIDKVYLWLFYTNTEALFSRVETKGAIDNRG
jgi:hypothetical protein